MIVLYILLPVLVVLFVFNCIVVTKIMKPTILSYEQCLKYEVDNNTFDKSVFDNLTFEKFFIESQFGYKLNCRFYDNKSEKTIIIVHGYTVNLMTSLRYFELYYNEGFNVLLYDHRHHGNSGGANTSMGYYEKYDLSQIVNWLEKKMGQNCCFGVHGESMGAATTLLFGGIDDRASFLIVDSSYSNLKTQLTEQVRMNIPFLPRWYINILSLCNKILFGFFYNDVSPVNTVNLIKCPVLYFHGATDKLVDYRNSEQLLEKTRGIKKLYITENANHAMSVIVDKSQYKTRVLIFIRYIQERGNNEKTNNEKQN